MSLFAKLFGNSHRQEFDQPIDNTLQDIPLNDLGIEGEEDLKALVVAKDYSGMKFKCLDLYNLAYDKYLESPRQEADLELMYAAMKNFEACELMWYYHDQILALESTAEEFEVSINPTLPFELPDSKYYHGEEVPSDGLKIPFADFYEELSDNMLPIEKHFAYDIMVVPR